MYANYIFCYSSEVNESTVIVTATEWKIDQANEDLKALETLLEEAYT